MNPGDPLGTIGLCLASLFSHQEDRPFGSLFSHLPHHASNLALAGSDALRRN